MVVAPHPAAVRRTRGFFVVAAVAALSAQTPNAEAQAVAPHASWAVLPWTNGHGSAAYDTVRRRVTSFREHLYARRDENTATRA
jgi:hypothetical protein